MVAATAMGWLAGIGDNLKKSLHPDSQGCPKLGILAFDTAKTMSRLVSLYKSLSDNEISNLRINIMKSQGVTYLNSEDEGYLLSLACAERLEDLDKVAASIGRLGRKCSEFSLNRFGMIYSNLKLSTIDFGRVDYKSRGTQRTIDKMENLILATSGLYTSLEDLAELEISERKLNMWKKNNVAMQNSKMNFEIFEEKIANQRKDVRHYKETSLWNKTFNKSVGLMAKTACIVYARICAIFGPYIHFMEDMKEEIHSKSGPIPVTAKASLVRFYSTKSVLFKGYEIKNNQVFHAAGEKTLGGCGLALRYANVILLAEKYLDIAVTIGDDARDSLYGMLPENLRVAVRLKLGRNLGDDDECLAEGWREALREMMRWLGPIGHDTLTWQMERNLEKKKFDSKPTVLLMQTLHFADKEKTEAAIVEVLVGLSYIYRCESRRLFES